MSDGIGAAKAQDAVRALRVNWEQTARVWRDDAAKQFETEQVRPLERLGEAARNLAESLENLLANARRLAP